MTEYVSAYTVTYLVKITTPAHSMAAQRQSIGLFLTKRTRRLLK
jgi:hypothetical protein